MIRERRNVDQGKDHGEIDIIDHSVTAASIIQLINVNLIRINIVSRSYKRKAMFDQKFSFCIHFSDNGNADPVSVFLVQLNKGGKKRPADNDPSVRIVPQFLLNLVQLVERF